MTKFQTNALRAISKMELTNLYLFEVLLEDYLRTSDHYDGISKREISRIWAERGNRYVKNFYESYCSRKLAMGVLAYEGERYRLTVDSTPSPVAE